MRGFLLVALFFIEQVTGVHAVGLLKRFEHLFVIDVFQKNNQSKEWNKGNDSTSGGLSIDDGRCKKIQPEHCVHTSKRNEKPLCIFKHPVLIPHLTEKLLSFGFCCFLFLDQALSLLIKGAIAVWANMNLFHGFLLYEHFDGMSTYCTNYHNGKITQSVIRLHDYVTLNRYCRSSKCW